MRATSKKILRERQQALDFIREFWRTNKSAPTIKEIAFYLRGQVRQAGNVKVAITDPLIDEGFLKVGGKWQTRTIRLASPQPRKRYYEDDAS